MTLNWTVALLLVLMLRRTLTWLRKTRVGRFLPLDSSVAAHRLVGYVTTVVALVHTVAHLARFGKEKQTNMRMIFTSWSIASTGVTLFCFLFAGPPLLTFQVFSIRQPLQGSGPLSSENPYNTGCLVENGYTKCTYTELVFTTCGNLGWFVGSASISGVVLVVVGAIMFFGALPCVRRSGRFEVRGCAEIGQTNICGRGLLPIMLKI